MDKPFEVHLDETLPGKRSSRMGSAELQIGDFG